MAESSGNVSETKLRLMLSPKSIAQANELAELKQCSLPELFEQLIEAADRNQVKAKDCT